MRLFFPYIYLALLAPLMAQNAHAARAILAAICLIAAFIIQARVVRRLAPLILTSLCTFVPFIVIVQSAVCSSQSEIVQPGLVHCVANATFGVLATVAIGGAVMLLAAANEWRGSLLNTVNGMALPRNIRTMAVVGGVMVGEFQKAMLRVHHAFTSRGDAAPSFRPRNLLVLPGILACVWSSVLRMASDRLSLQWSSESYWNSFVPPGRPTKLISRGNRYSDLLILAVLVVCMLIVAPYVLHP